MNKAALLIFVFYLAGQFMHNFKRADMKQGTPSAFKSPLQALAAFLSADAKAVSVRLFLATLGMLFWISQPDAVQQLASVAAGQLSEGILKAILVKVQLPLNIVTAALYGFFADSLLDWATAKVPFLKKEIPGYKGDQDYSEST